MVSPSKKRKLEAKTQPKATGAAVRNIAVTGDCRLRRSQKPLSDKRFYLDLKNHISATRIETRLRSFGAVVDAFLAKEVNYVVTDRPSWSGAVPSSQQRQQSGCTPPWHSSALITLASPATGDSPTDIGTRRLLQRSRAGAMLEKARQQQTHLNTIDPLENAVRWNLPIWPVDKVQKWLDKIESSLNNKLNHFSLKTKPIKSPYIKFEDLSKQYRPVYSTLTSWPTINIDCGEGGCPFSIPKSPSSRDSKPTKNAPYAMLGQPICDQRMTRKSRMQLPKKEDLVKAKLPAHPGYCEICDIEYPNVQEHIISNSHRKFVQDNKNYQDLDSLIKDGPSVEAFFKVLDPIGCTTRRTPRGAASPPWSAPDSTTDSFDICDAAMKRPSLGNGQMRRSSQRQAEERSKAAARKDSNEPLMNGISKIHACKLPSNDRRSAEDDTPHNLRPRLTAIEESGFKRLRSRNSEGSASLEDSCDSCGDLDANTRHKTDPSRARQCRNSSGSDSVSNNLRPKRDPDDIVNGKQGSCSEDSTCSLQSTRGSRAKAKIPKKKRLSVEEKLLEDNKEYYKLEVINAKLRSSGYFCNQRDIALPENGNDDSGDGDGQRDEAKCLSARRSRRSVLNHEASSYHFGDKSIKKEVSSPVYQNPNQSPLQIHIYTDECANHVPSAPLAERSMLPSIKEELGSPQSNDEGCSDGSPNHHCDGERKKRRTHAEVFIHDNLDYYKFQLPESRLRLHGITSNTPHLPYKTDADGGISPKYSAPCHSQDYFSPDDIPCSRTDQKANLLSRSESNIIALLANVTPEVVDKMKFSFEEIPQSEPWFQTYKRQDEGDEIVETFSDFELERRYVLPYEIPSETIFTRFGRGRGRGGRGMRGIHRGQFRLLPKSRAQQLVAAARNPRKSPRCHASTLAILSSFVNRRRRQSLGLPKEATESIALPTAAPECLSDFQEIEKNLNEMLASSPSSPVQDFGCKPTGRVRRRSQRRATESSKEAVEFLELGQNLDDSDAIDPEVPSASNTSQTCGLNANSDIDVVKLFDEYPKCHCVSELQVEQQCELAEDEASLRRLEMELECTSSTYDTMSETGTNYSSVRGRCKKRKRNLTGWPSAKPKKKKLDTDPADNFVGIRLKKCPVNTRGKMHFTYRPTNSRGRGRIAGSSRQTSSVESTRRTRAHLESHSESLQERSPSHRGGKSPRGAYASTSGDAPDVCRPNRGSSSSLSPRRRESPRMQGRVRTRWGAPPRRQRC